MIFFDIFHRTTKHEKIIFLSIFFLSFVLSGTKHSLRIYFTKSICKAQRSLYPLSIPTQLRLGDDSKPIDITRFRQVIGGLYYFFDLSRYFLHSHQVVLVHVVNLSASKSWLWAFILVLKFQIFSPFWDPSYFPITFLPSKANCNNCLWH